MSGRYITNKGVTGFSPAQHVRDRGPIRGGADLQRPAPFNADNPPVSSKSDRRYGHNSTHGEQPTSPQGRPVPGSMPAQQGLTPGRLISRQVGHLGGGSDKRVPPTHPNTGVTTGGIYPPRTRSK